MSTIGEYIYELRVKKLQQKVSQLFFVVLGVFNNILKVYQSLPTRNVFFSRWRLRWAKGFKIAKLLHVLTWQSDLGLILGFLGQ